MTGETNNMSTISPAVQAANTLTALWCIDWVPKTSSSRAATPVTLILRARPHIGRFFAVDCSTGSGGSEVSGVTSIRPPKLLWN